MHLLAPFLSKTSLIEVGRQKEIFSSIRHLKSYLVISSPSKVNVSELPFSTHAMSTVRVAAAGGASEGLWKCRVENATGYSDYRELRLVLWPEVPRKCLGQTIATTKGTFHWRAADANSFAELKCPVGLSGRAFARGEKNVVRRRCKSDGNWAEESGRDLETAHCRPESKLSREIEDRIVDSPTADGQDWALLKNLTREILEFRCFLEEEEMVLLKKAFDRLAAVSDANTAGDQLATVGELLEFEFDNSTAAVELLSRMRRSLGGYRPAAFGEDVVGSIEVCERKLQASDFDSDFFLFGGTGNISCRVAGTSSLEGGYLAKLPVRELFVSKQEDVHPAIAVTLLSLDNAKFFGEFEAASVDGARYTGEATVLGYKKTVVVERFDFSKIAQNRSTKTPSEFKEWEMSLRSGTPNSTTYVAARSFRQTTVDFKFAVPSASISGLPAVWNEDRRSWDLLENRSVCVDFVLHGRSEVLFKCDVWNFKDFLCGVRNCSSCEDGDCFDGGYTFVSFFQPTKDLLR